MTFTSVYILLSTVMFIVFALLLSGNYWLTAVLRGFSIVMAIFGVIVGLASMGVVVSTDVRLV